MFTAERTHAAWVPAIIAFAAAVVGACLLQLSSAASALDGLTEVLSITGWVVVVWAAIAGVAAGALLSRRGGLTTRSARASIALVAATVATLALVWLLFPPIGSGGGMG